MEKNEIVMFYQRDIQKVIDELNLFKNEANIWKTCGTINNSSGNLALHLIGGLNYLIGTNLAQTDYVRNRALEFTAKGIESAKLIEQLNELSLLIGNTVGSLTQEQLDSPIPIFFDKENATVNYVLMQLLLHLNYHLGQINYLRRALE